MKDAIYPSSNQYGVPDLFLKSYPVAPGLSSHFAAWGSVSRKSEFRGTWHFYVDDYRFQNLYKDADSLIRTGCSGAVEPNFSIFEETPFAVALHRIYQKRWIARSWQASKHDLELWVDLCVSGYGRQLALIGVPAGWQRFATAGWEKNVEDLDDELSMAVACSSGEPFTLIVYGGGKEVDDWCKNRNSVLRIPHRRSKAARPGEGTRLRLKREQIMKEISNG